MLCPLSLKLFGHNICAGDYLHLISEKQQPIKITSWSSKQQQGEITLGDFVLISPGVNILAAHNIAIGNNCMIAANVTISDSDWHGIYNRVRPFRCTQPVRINNNVWIGINSIITKGVTIGENSIIGAGSVVTGNIPANVIAAGNPAKIIRELNPKRKMLKREFLFNGNEQYWEQQEGLENVFNQSNTTFNWLKAHLLPSTND